MPRRRLGAVSTILYILISAPASSEPPKTTFPALELRMAYGSTFNSCTGQDSHVPGTEPVACLEDLTRYRAEVSGFRDHLSGEALTREAAAQSLIELRAEVAEKNAGDPEMLAKIDAVFEELFAQEPSSLPAAEAEVQRLLIQ